MEAGAGTKSKHIHTPLPDSFGKIKSSNLVRPSCWTNCHGEKVKVPAVLGKCRLNIRLQTLICSRFNEHLSHCHWSNALLWILLPLLHRSAHRRKFRSQTSDNVDKWKSRGGKSQRRERQQKEDQRREDAGARKGRKVAIHCVFPMVCGSGESKSRLAKVAGAGPSAR